VFFVRFPPRRAQRRRRNGPPSCDTVPQKQKFMLEPLAFRKNGSGLSGSPAPEQGVTGGEGGCAREGAKNAALRAFFDPAKH